VDTLGTSLDASAFSTSSAHYDIKFHNLLLNIYGCYELMKADKIKVPKNDENKIRDILLINYLSDKHIRNTICNIYNFRFDKEVDENDGRVDIKIINKNDFEDFDAYYIIECKRLDGRSTLNNKYVSEGLNRFLNGKYSSSYGVNGMIGFIIKDIDINANMHKIGSCFKLIQKDKLYSSYHKGLKLHHLMLDLSKNIK
jgi:hypothetical protein